MSMTPELYYKVGRAKLNQKAVDLSRFQRFGLEARSATSAASARFLASYQEAKSVYKDYLNLFDELVEHAIISEQEAMFPLVDDTIARSGVQSIYVDMSVMFQSLNTTCASLSTGLLETSESRTARSFLRKIPLRSFDGKFHNWPQYRDIYLSLVHNDPGIPTIEKFHHLLGSLTGEALSIVSMFPIVEENYDKAWKELLLRFNNKRLLATNYFSQICDVKPKKFGGDLMSLQTFLRIIGENFAAIESLNMSNESDFYKLTVALDRLEPSVREEFEAQYIEYEFPTYKSLIEFVRQKCKILELSKSKGGTVADSSSVHHQTQKSKVLSTVASSNQCGASDAIQPSNQQRYSCLYCSKDHLLFLCDKFKAIPVNKKLDFVKISRLCYNCLRRGHTAKLCNSRYLCMKCHQRHHTLIHESAPTNQENNDSAPCTASATSPTAAPAVLAVQRSEFMADTSTVLLGTALVNIIDRDGVPQSVRAVIDSGSQHSIISSSCAKRLGLSRLPCRRRMHGVGLTPLPAVKGKVDCTIVSPKEPTYILPASPIVLPTITSNLPMTDVSLTTELNFHLHELADTEFWKSSPVELLLGCDMFMKILTPQPAKLMNNGLGAISTIFGWVIMGNISAQERGCSSNCLITHQDPLSDEILQKFWETEEVHPKPFEHPMERKCEDYFNRTTSRLESGRYMVALPFVDENITLDDSWAVALSRFRKLETRLAKQPKLREKYTEFLNEYRDLGHMSLTSEPSSYIIPHHAVTKDADPAEKIRVVFDASMATATGSLNDKLLPGPKLQCDLPSIITSFRKYNIAFATDMIKMYRQIKVIPAHRKYQHILWRAHPEEELQKYELNTVTYGLRSAPYLALRVLKQLIIDEGSAFPEALRVLSKEVYVDDIITGAQTLNDALNLKEQLLQLLAKGGFPLHKWCSNSTEFLSGLDQDRTSACVSLSPKDIPATKILGMCWNPTTDEFFYRLNILPGTISKRSILSTIARLFDPIGFLSPVIFFAKCIMQQLWLLKIDWDDPLPASIAEGWMQFLGNMNSLANIRIPRCLRITSAERLELYGFCDASQKGFAAVLYLRVVKFGGCVEVFLLKSKTKLAPLKTISLPRLELSAALLLVNLLHSVQDFIEEQLITSIKLFTDSTIVLSWLQLPPYSLHTFVANRVSKILSMSKGQHWYYVPSEQNSADVASRGIEPHQLEHHTLWWHGPHWLSLTEVTLPPTPPAVRDVPELKSKSSFVLSSINYTDLVSWMETISNYTRLIHILAYMYRFVKNAKEPGKRSLGALTVEEQDQAFTCCVSLLQQHYFAEEFDFKDNAARSKRLKSLDVFKDQANVLRVGGRLRHSKLPYAVKHPILLHAQSHFIKIYIDFIHYKYYHLGPKALQAYLQRSFWIFGVRGLVRQRIFKCMTCYRQRAQPINPFMGDLPLSRVQQGRPFATVGADFAGPFYVKQGQRRNSPSAKCYLCIFVCFATKAVHLEIVSALTTDAFLAAFDRFISRRGLPTAVYTDRGTNFIGASNRLKELYNWLKQQDTQHKITSSIADQGIEFHFLPPGSPHLGGLWEAAVKSAKTHLGKVLVDRPFSFEELSTIFARIEGILNSRPLCSISLKPENYDYLTPGHFLIGAPLLSVPEKDTTHLPLNRLSRWQLVQNSVQHFWRRWEHEYLHSLQQRVKWTAKPNPVKNGDLVLLYEPTVRPMDWKLGRILDVHPGTDNIIRLVTVKTISGIQKRLVTKIIPLPQIQEEPHKT